jgi:hypothetical protein
MRVLAYLLVPYFVVQGFSLLLGNADRLIRVPAMLTSMATVAGLSAALFALDRLHRNRRAADSAYSSYPLVAAAVAALLAASLVQTHIVGSLNSLHLLLVLAASTALTLRLRRAYRRRVREQHSLIARLEATLSRVEVLEGLLPICASCKKIRDDTGNWQVVEEYFMDRTRLRFTHGYCPDCAGALMRSAGIANP